MNICCLFHFLQFWLTTSYSCLEHVHFLALGFKKKSAAAPGVNGAVSVTSVTLKFKTKLSEPQGVKVSQTWHVWMAEKGETTLQEHVDEKSST